MLIRTSPLRICITAICGLLMVPMVQCQPVPSLPRGKMLSPRDLHRMVWEFPFVPPKKQRIDPSVDLSEWFPPAGDQFDTHACSGWSVGYGLGTFLYNKERGIRRSSDMPMDPWQTFSPRFLYESVLRDMNASSCYTDVSLWDALVLAHKNGTCWWAQSPFERSDDCIFLASQDAIDSAKVHRSQIPISINARDPHQWKSYLDNEQPIVFTASIDSTFDDGLKTGGDSMFVWDRAVPVGDEWNDRTHHFMLCIGYDDHDSTWLIYNSWGEKWGLKGLGKITYRTMDWTCSEAYIVRPGDIPPTPLVDTVATAARTKRSGSYKGKGRVEDLHQAHGVAWRFLPERDLDHSHVEFMDARSLQRIHVVSVRDGQPVSFYHEGDLYTFRAMGKALFSGASRYEVVLNSDDQRGYLDQVRERLDLLEDGVIGN